MKEIGGFFELQLRKGEHYHKGAVQLNTARNCLEYILRAKKYKKIYIPYLDSEVIWEPMQKLGIDYEFYSVDLGSILYSIKNWGKMKFSSIPIRMA